MTGPVIITVDDRWGLRGGTKANLVTVNPIPLTREAMIETDTGRIKVGNGVDRWLDLQYINLGFIDFSGISEGDVPIWDSANDRFKIGAPAAGSSFNPSSLFTTATGGAWYDPSDLSTLWQDTAGTTPVTASGQSVARIDDKSGLGNHATQANAGNRPTYLVDSQGNRLLSFDGNDYLECGSAFNIATVTAGVAYTATNIGGRILDARGTGVLGTIAGWYMKARNASSDLIGFDDGAGQSIGFTDTTAITLAQPHVLITRFASKFGRYYLDGGNLALADSNNGSIGSIVGAQPSRIGTASNAAGTQSLAGFVYQIIVTNQPINWGEKDDLRRYLLTKGNF